MLVILSVLNYCFKKIELEAISKQFTTKYKAYFVLKIN